MTIHRALITTLAAVTMTSTAPDAAAQQPAGDARAAGTFEWHTWSGDAGSRRYRLFVPAGHDAARAAPLVVMLHGCTQDPDDFARGTRFNALAGEAGVLVAWPEQPAAMQVQKCWSWFDPAHQAASRGEPAVIAGITREVMAGHAIDPRRVYIVGVSAGAAMAVNVAASYPDLFAAIGSHSGIPYRAASDVPHALAVMRGGSPDPAILAYALQDALGGRAMPLIAIHGGADAVVSPMNSRQLAGQWAGVLGVSSSPVQRSTEGGLGVERTRWSGADGKPAIELVIVDGLGHAWSGGSPEGTYTDARGPDASRLILDFLLAHSR
ncbi:PHB depolymerase family esterase [Longimicrobium sp.]|uniref:extracellular catalytic domain type 1 short-chain-length polyhydroxyalkanoate depolymerase n=1 Tax=Longimicrobium sp. TaxID=2029185 RepID=UPI002D7EA530|nr:PHB depolymerase family esterase [Longimicrobium sp.]